MSRNFAQRSQKKSKKIFGETERGWWPEKWFSGGGSRKSSTRTEVRAREAGKHKNTKIQNTKNTKNTKNLNTKKSQIPKELAHGGTVPPNYM